MVCSGLYGQQQIADFTSIQPTSQTTDFIIPSSHVFQKIIETGDPLTEGGVLPTNTDFTAYVPIGGSSELGYLSINSEAAPGGVSILDINFNQGTKLWQTTRSEAVDFSSVVATAANCSGTVTEWNTVISCEEVVVGTDLNGDGHNDIGWCIEIDPVTKTVIDKLWELGNFAHENVAIHSNQRTVYQGADSNPGYLYKFVADNSQDLSSGSLYVYSGSKNGSGNWILLDNSTPAERNSTLTQSANVGATVFNGIEDVEIGPDGLVYFAVKGEDRVYRFQDSDPLSGTTVPLLETYVGNTVYTINHVNGSSQVNWGRGNDNLAFDGEGNLWVFQDGDNHYIWLVKNGHTQANPQVEIFGSAPAGSEPTGITFSPDFRFMFMSIQHPSNTNNSSTQIDMAGQSVGFEKNISLVIARKENLGTLWYLDADGDGFATSETVASFNSPGTGYTTEVLPTTDCDDSDALINPNTVWYIDNDGDGYAQPDAVTSCTSPGAGYTTNLLPTTDCDDNDPDINPATVWYLDADGDGYAHPDTVISCESPGMGYDNMVLPTTDCDDNDPTITDAVQEWFTDMDGDGYASTETIMSCTSPGPEYTNSILPATDCNDNDPSINPNTVWYLDADGDGYAHPDTIISCESPGTGYDNMVLPTTDCDDNDPTITDAVQEWFIDMDGDGYASMETIMSCASPGSEYTNSILPATDCNDNDPSINPNTVWYLDADGDGYAHSETITGCSNPGDGYTQNELAVTDCNDNDPEITDALIEWFLDEDADGYANPVTVFSCDQPGEAYTSTELPVTDCDDTDFSVNPENIWYLDNDQDGFAISTLLSCSSPGSSYTRSELPVTDCDDEDADINPNTLWYPDANMDGLADGPAVTSCTSPGPAYTSEVLPIEEPPSDNILFPNPTDGLVTISLDELYSRIEVTLVNAVEKLIFVRQFENTRSFDLDLIGLSSGVYYLHIQSEKGRVEVIPLIIL